MADRPVGARTGDVIDRLFVYGTLRPGAGAYHVVEGDVLRVAEGRLGAHSLVGLGLPYPWCVEAADPDDSVVGAILWLGDPPVTLARLDVYERAQGPDAEYLRDVRTVTTSEGDVECWVYLGRSVPASAVTVPGGDWIRP